MSGAMREAKRHRSCCQGAETLKGEMDRGKPAVLGEQRREVETRAERGGGRGGEGSRDRPATKEGEMQF